VTPDAAPGPERRALPTAVVLLGVTALFTDVGTEMIFPLLPVFLVTVLGAGPTYLGLMEGAANAVASLVKLGSGVLADRTARRRPLVLLGYGLASVVRPFLAVATRPWHALAIRLTDRVGKGIRGSPRDALIADVAGDRAGRAFGFHDAMDNVGAVVGPLLATALVAGGLSIRQVFWVAVIPGIVATTCVFFVKEPERSPAPSPNGAPPRGLRSTFGTSLVSYLGIVGLFSLGNSSDAFLLLRASSLGVSNALLPVLWSALNLSKVAFTYLGGHLADRHSRSRLILGGWVVYAAVYVGLGAASAAWQVWTLFLVYGIFYGLTEPVEKALVAELAPAGARGSAYGVYNFMVGVAAVPAGIITGALWNRFGAAVALDGAAGFAAAACVLLAGWQAWRSRAAQSTGAPQAG
jgi:MFS family permease